jgi:hypothetical protein
MMTDVNLEKELVAHQDHIRMLEEQAKTLQSWIQDSLERGETLEGDEGFHRIAQTIDVIVEPGSFLSQSTAASSSDR